MPSLLSPLPGLYVVLLAALLAAALRRWFDAVPGRCWAVWGAALVPVFAPVLLAGRVLLPLGYLTQVPPFTRLWSGPPPGNLIQSDLVLLILPWLVRVRAAFAAGAWPLWNHLSGAGEPLLANPQSQALQPLAWLAAPFPAATAVAVTAALKVLLAFVFTYLLLRRQGLSLAPSLWGSLAFGLAGFLQLWLGWPLSGSAALLPVLLYGIAMVAERGWRRDSLLTAGTVGALAGVGHPETELHVAVLAAAFALSRLAALSAGRRRRPLRQLLAAAALGGLLAAPALLPAAAYIPQTLRASVLAGRQAEIRGQGPRRAALLEQRFGSRAGALSRLLPAVAPNAFGNNRFGAYWGAGNTVEDASAFTGTAALLGFLLACLPLARRPPAGAPARFPQERLMLAVALVSALVLACPPALVAVFNALPVLRDSLYFHSRVTLLLNFAVAYAAACTWERWRRGELPRAAILPAAALLAAAAIWAYQAHPGPPHAWPLVPVRLASLALHLAVLAAAAIWLLQAPRWLTQAPGARRAAGLGAGKHGGPEGLSGDPGGGPGGPPAGIGAAAGLALAWGGALLVAGELLAIHAPANPPAPAALYFPAVPPVEFVRRRLDPWHRMAGLGPALRPNLATVYGLADPRSANPLKPVTYLEATSRINRFPNRPADGFVNPEDPLYGLLGVSYVMTSPRVPLAPPLRLAFSSPEAWVYERPGALPRLFLPGSAVLCRDPSWSACTAGIADFAAAAAVREGPPALDSTSAGTRSLDSTSAGTRSLDSPGAGTRSLDSPGAGTLSLVAIDAAEIRTRARLSAPRLLATSVLQDGGWKLLVGGRRQPTTLANGPFVAAWLPPGESDLALLYRPRGFLLGVLIAAAALATGAALWIPPPLPPVQPSSRLTCAPPVVRC
jgi:hypothetical protein